MKNFRIYGNPPFKVVLIHGGPGACGEMRSVAENISPKIGVLEPLQTSLTIQGEINRLKTIFLDSFSPPLILIGFSLTLLSFNKSACLFIVFSSTILSMFLQILYFRSPCFLIDILVILPPFHALSS